MSGETSYNELHEKVIKLEMLIGLTDNADGQVDVIVKVTAEEFNITVDNPSTASKEEEKFEPVSLGEWKNYLFEGFNISDEAPKKLTQRLFRMDCRWAVKASCRQVRTDWSTIEAYRDKMGNPFDVQYVEVITQQTIGSLDCGLFIAAYAEYLSDGLQVPNNGIDVGLLRKRYAVLLWKYGEAKSQKPYASDIKDPQRPK
ncbi:hypothetical protein BC332_08247 [Capsicum chinense]|nr:hypothetical protein BC332_08247 [Capsicum chinense]